MGKSENGQKSQEALGTLHLCVGNWGLDGAFVTIISVEGGWGGWGGEGTVQCEPGPLCPVSPVPTHTQNISPSTAKTRDEQHGPADENAGLPASGGEVGSSLSLVGPRARSSLMGTCSSREKLPFHGVGGQVLVSFKWPPPGWENGLPGGRPRPQGKGKLWSAFDENTGHR